MKVEKKAYTPHPEGWYLFLLGEPEHSETEWRGKKRTRLLWPCYSTAVQEETTGEDLVVNLFTGLAVTSHKSDVHRQLAENGFGLKAEDYNDTDQISGKFFTGKVERSLENGRHSIVAFDTKERCRPSGGTKTDPFAEENDAHAITDESTRRRLR